MTPQEIEQIIKMLAEKLGPIGGQVWAIYVRQVYVNIIGNAVWMLAFLFGAAACGYWLRMGKRDGRLEAIIGLALSLLLALGAFTFGVLQIVNPEYHAIEMLLGR